MKVRCPVDKRNLGDRPGLVAFKSFCKTCLLWYIWETGQLIPRNEKPKHCGKKCGCAWCVAHGK